MQPSCMGNTVGERKHIVGAWNESTGFVDHIYSLLRSRVRVQVVVLSSPSIEIFDTHTS